MLKRVIARSVKGNTAVLRFCRNSGTTEPLLPMTLP
jgi:hypothetical protein